MNEPMEHPLSLELIYLHPDKLFISCRLDEVTRERWVYIGFHRPRFPKKQVQRSVEILSKGQKDIFRSELLKDRTVARKVIEDKLVKSLVKGDGLQSNPNGAMITLIRTSKLTPLTQKFIDRIMKRLDLSDDGIIMTNDFKESLKREYRYV